MLHSLNVAQTGLKASQTQVENVMNNIANENVAGYKKRVVDASELSHADARKTGRGIFIDGVSRTTQIYMYQNLINEEAKLNDLTELNTTLADIESIFTETDTAGFSAELNNYFKSIENLRTTPHSEVYKNDIVTTANSIILELQKTYAAIESKESLMLSNTNEVVDKVNSILKEIGAISKKISDTTNGTPNDLLDKRDALERELAQYIDVEISRESNYQLKIGGVTAVRFDTNIHEVNLIENYSPQVDVYAQIDTNGHTVTTGINNDFKSSIITNPLDPNAGVDGNVVMDGNPSPSVAEVQTLDISGTVDSSNSVEFLNTSLTIAAGSDGTAVAAAIAADAALGYDPTLPPAGQSTILYNWNQNNPDKEIATITNVGNTLTITYVATEGDVPAIANNSNSGIDFTGSIEDDITPAANAGKGYVESLTYTLNGTHSITIAIGETITDEAGNPVDFDNSGGGGVITRDNMIQALVYKINENNDIGSVVTAYNGKYEVSKNGVKVLTNDVLHSKYQDPALGTNAPGFDDRYLYIEANVDGKDGEFVGELLINTPVTNPAFATDPTAPQYINEREYIERNSYVSEDAIDDIHLEIYDKEIDVNGGSLKPLIDNLKTDSGNNLFNVYKEKLDQFAKKLVDLTESFIENSDYSYIFGNQAVNESYDADQAVAINLFNGASVKTLEFNKLSLNTLTQEKLDYLAELQWKENIDFDGTGENNQSFSKFYQTLRVKVADDREGVIFKEEAQMAVKESLQSTYENIVKVDKDEELVELIKFQKAYEANAKVITVVDEMLATLLAIKR